MAARLGQFLGAVSGLGSGHQVESLTLTFSGRLAQLKTDLVRNAAIAGLLGGSEGVNRIHAASAAAERGLRLQEDKREYVPGGTGATLRLMLHTSAGSSAVTGTVLHGRSPRLLRYDGIDIEAELAGTLLVVRNNDVPGVIGHIGTLLGEAQLNIANFALGRRPANDATASTQAVAIVQVDNPEPNFLSQAIDQLRALPDITSVRLLDLGPL